MKGGFLLSLKELKVIKVNIDYLNKCLDYDSSTGCLSWKKRPENHFKDKNTFKMWNTKFSNKTAGSLDQRNGYISVRIDNRAYLAHRIGWALYYGYFPENILDHKDRIRHHNWILNLREVSGQCNARNAGVMSNNKSGVKGVYRCKKTEKWRAEITIDRKTLSLGYHEKISDAVLKRWEAEKLYKFPNCDTSSSAYNYLLHNNLTATETV